MKEEGDDQPARSKRKGGKHSRKPDDSKRFGRRRFLGWTAAGGVAAAAAAAGYVESTSGGSGSAHLDSATGHHHRRIMTRAKLVDETFTGTVQGVALPLSRAILAENAQTGHAWWVTTQQNPGDIWGYADVSSAEVGDTVTLYVSTKADQFHVEAYRMGYYQGIGGRLVWMSDQVPGAQQPPPVVTSAENTIECPWLPSLSFTISDIFPPGAYLLKLVGTSGEQQFVPLCIRDDSSKAAIVVQHSITTWQAYNRWGGYSLYYGNTDGSLSYTHDPGNGTYDARARIVSFDRPYDYDWASGAADFVGNELPLIYQAEQLGLDVTYWTDVDFHTNPSLLTNHKALLSLGHDEYWSTPMRDGATQALAAGVNLAFLGANACFRQIRMQPSPLGANRQQICYKDATEDPLTGVDNDLVTVNWPDPPVSRPECEMIGSTYQDIEAQADMAVVEPSSWVLAGVDLPPNQQLPNMVRGEFDRYVPGGGGPTNVEIIAHSIVPNRGDNYSDVTWYTVDGGGGVLATGNASWVGQLATSTLIPPNVLPDAEPGVTPQLLRAMLNVYSVLGLGPAGETHPSQPNWESVYTSEPAPDASSSTINAA
jgi:hypothetical protein